MFTKLYRAESSAADLSLALIVLHEIRDDLESFHVDKGEKVIRLLLSLLVSHPTLRNHRFVVLNETFCGLLRDHLSLRRNCTSILI